MTKVINPSLVANLFKRFNQTDGAYKLNNQQNYQICFIHRCKVVQHTQINTCKAGYKQNQILKTSWLSW